MQQMSSNAPPDDNGFFGKFGGLLGSAAIMVVAIGHMFNYRRDFYVPVEEVVATETARTRRMAMVS